jgi:deoxyribodipyrimidine photo-lyase
MFRPLPQIVWFKRDLRLHDHAPFTRAAQDGPILPLLIYEPAYWRNADTSYRQYEFWSGCVADLSAQISRRGGTLLRTAGSIIEFLESLKSSIGPFALWSHQETGNAWTYKRDRVVKAWIAEHGLQWTELPQFGVHRGPNLDRDHWSAAWDRFMAQPTARIPETITWQPRPFLCPAPPTAAALGLTPDGLKHPQLPGRAAAHSLLSSFLHERGQFYTRQMSSPATAETACSRLSPYLAYGCLSMRETTQLAIRRAAQLDPHADTAWHSAMRSFIARLHWHCHFIQKLESEPAIETRPFVSAFQNLRPEPDQPSTLQRWITGRTGYPFLDAAMRYLIAHGWINFRMRAMLMSFATYDLWLPWQIAGTALARLFTDYEPGIHWPQCQMQSGETGINTLRVYSSLKQGFDQDPSGTFIRRWVPELANIQGPLIHQPWRLDQQDREQLCPTYPDRIVDHETASRAAKDRLHKARQSPIAQRQADLVQQRHGSRASSTQRRHAARQATQPKQGSLNL